MGTTDKSINCLTGNVGNSLFTTPKRWQNSFNTVNEISPHRFTCSVTSEFIKLRNISNAKLSLIIIMETQLDYFTIVINFGYTIKGFVRNIFSVVFTSEKFCIRLRKNPKSSRELLKLLKKFNVADKINVKHQKPKRFWAFRENKDGNGTAH